MVDIEVKTPEVVDVELTTPKVVDIELSAPESTADVANIDPTPVATFEIDIALIEINERVENIVNAPVPAIDTLENEKVLVEKTVDLEPHADISVQSVNLIKTVETSVVTLLESEFKTTTTEESSNEICIDESTVTTTFDLENVSDLPAPAPSIEIDEIIDSPVTES